jgi:hypothetical protein
MSNCLVCNDKRYIIAERDDGREAVEACDACNSNNTDEQAALSARADGIDCDRIYPCVVRRTTMKLYQIWDGDDAATPLYRAESVEAAMQQWIADHDGHLPWSIDEVPLAGPDGLVETIEVWSDTATTEADARRYAVIAGTPVEAALVEYRARMSRNRSGLHTETRPDETPV